MLPANPRRWPLAVQVPLLVAILMVAVGTLASSFVLARLGEIQENHLRQLAAAYLEGLATTLSPAVERRDVWETFDALDRMEHRYGELEFGVTFVALPDGVVLAASDPSRLPTFSAVPAAWPARLGGGQELVLDTGEGKAWAQRVVGSGSGPAGRIFAEIEIGDLLRERRRILLVLIGSNAALTLGVASLGYAAVRRMLRPLGRLAAQVETLRLGGTDALALDPPRQREFRALFERFAAMTAAVREREVLASRLAEEEKLARLGRLASGMAHEVNNPLAGMLTVVDTLKRGGGDPEVRGAALELLERGLAGIRDVVRAALVAYKESDDAGPLTPAAFDDLRWLVQHEVGRRRLTLAWANELPSEVAVDGGAVRQAVLNVLLNACRASPVGGRVAVAAAVEAGGLTVRVDDQGPGMPPEIRWVLERAEPDPPPGGRGLGGWAAARLAARLGGKFTVDLPPAGGTRLSLRVPLTSPAAAR